MSTAVALTTVRTVAGVAMLALSVIIFGISLWPCSTRVERELVATKEVIDDDVNDLPDASCTLGAGGAASTSERRHKTVHTEKAVAPPSTDWRPGFVAFGVILLALGTVFAVPTLLSDGTVTSQGDLNVSVMRVVLYGMFVLFSVITVRAGWGATSMSDIKIDPWWVSLLSLVSAAKVAQSFGEPPGKSGG